MLKSTFSFCPNLKIYRLSTIYFTFFFVYLQTTAHTAATPGAAGYAAVQSAHTNTGMGTGAHWQQPGAGGYGGTMGHEQQTDAYNQGRSSGNDDNICDRQAFSKVEDRPVMKERAVRLKKN